MLLKAKSSRECFVESGLVKDIEPLKKAKLIADAAASKKAEDIVIMNMKAVSNIADYFVIMSASSTRRAKTISSEIEEALRKIGIKYWHIEGKREALWVLVDYGDVIVHIFYNKMREFYNLERLWHEAPKERFLHHAHQANPKKPK